MEISKSTKSSKLKQKKPGNGGHTSAVGWNNCIVGWYDATVQMTATVLLSYQGLGLEIGSGKQYSQYAVIEVEGAGQARYHAGTFK